MKVISMQREKAVVSAATPEASSAGAEILAIGGNAVDAAVAVSLALGVSEPAGSGLGGQGMMLIQRPGLPAEVLNGTSFSPFSLPKYVGSSDLVGRRASTVPSLLRMLDFAWRSFGSGRLSWRQLLEPAIRLAYEGFPLGEFRHFALKRFASVISRDESAARLLLLKDNVIPRQGSTVRFPLLGHTLERVASEGAVDFYEGAIAREISDDMENKGGWITNRDLASVGEPRVLPALVGTYRGWEVSTLPPPAAGWIVLLGLNILERAPQQSLSNNGTERLTWMARAIELCQRRSFASPIHDLVEYESEVAAQLDKQKAERLLRTHRRGPLGETTHFSLVDSDGTTVSMTQSLNAYFGSKVAHPSLGFLYNDYMHSFSLAKHRHPFALHPHVMPISWMSATILSREGALALALGSAGDSRIISSVIHVISHWVDIREGIEAAVSAPRVHSLGADELLLEVEPIRYRTLLRLEEQGFTVYRPLSSLFTGKLNPYFGGVHAVAHETDGWRGAADPRRDGAVS